MQLLQKQTGKFSYFVILKEKNPKNRFQIAKISSSVCFPYFKYPNWVNYPRLRTPAVGSGVIQGTEAVGTGITVGLGTGASGFVQGTQAVGGGVVSGTPDGMTKGVGTGISTFTSGKAYSLGVNYKIN